MIKYRKEFSETILSLHRYSKRIIAIIIDISFDFMSGANFVLTAGLFRELAMLPLQELPVSGTLFFDIETDDSLQTAQVDKLIEWPLKGPTPNF